MDYPFLNQLVSKGIQEMVFVMKVCKDRQFTYTLLNDAAKKLTGLTETAIGKTFHEALDNDWATTLKRIYNNVLETGEIVTYEDYYESSSGRRYTETTLTPLFQDGACTHIAAVVQDITKQKQSELEVRKSQMDLEQNKQRFRSLFDYNMDAILALDLNGVIQRGNKAVESVFGYEAEKLSGKPVMDLIPEPGKIARIFKEANNKLHHEQQLQVRHKSGAVVEVIVRFTPIVVQDEMVGVYGIFKDINEKVQLGKKYQDSEDHFQIIAEHSTDLITMVDKQGKIVYASPSYKEILGFEAANYIGQYFLHNVHEDYWERLRASFNDSVKTDTAWREQFKQITKKGSYIWSELHGSPVYNDEGQFRHMVVVSRNITGNKDYEEKLTHMAYHDPLSEVPNRRYFMEKLKHYLSEIKGRDHRVAVIMLDLDDFKIINDNMGHDMGDKVIQEFCNRIRTIIRKEDMFARMGGDEFTLLLSNIKSVQSVHQIVRRIVDLMNEPWSFDDHHFFVTASIGVVISSPKETDDVNSILKYADVELYKAKRDGGNTYRLLDICDLRTVQ